MYTYSRIDDTVILHEAALEKRHMNEQKSSYPDNRESLSISDNCIGDILS